VQFLTKEIDFVRKEDVRAFKLTEVEALCGELIRTRHKWVNIFANPVTEIEAVRDNGF